MSLLKRIQREFEQRFGGRPPTIVRAPGRVNLIGEHTDYNDGFVLPMAIDRGVWIALRPRHDWRVILYSLDFDQQAGFSLAGLRKEGVAWKEYIKGVAWAMQEAGFTLSGWEGVIAGDVPVGAGLSSSAALELASARAFATVSDIPWDAATMARLSQRAENEWVGVNCGIMDQMISAAGRAGHALLIDCRSLDTELVPLPPDAAVVVLDTSTRRGLVDSAYNERRAQCQEAADFFDVPALRDVTLEQFEMGADGLDEVIRRRARHVITENRRTIQFRGALHRGDAFEAGKLMNASHVSLRDDFQVSSQQLNTIVGFARQEEICFGARMTGAGFGGCAVALIRASGASEFTERVARNYKQATGLTAKIYVCDATDGAEVISMSRTVQRKGD